MTAIDEVVKWIIIIAVLSAMIFIAISLMGPLSGLGQDNPFAGMFR